MNSLPNISKEYESLLSKVSELVLYAQDHVPTKYDAKANKELVSEADTYIEQEIKKYIAINFPNEETWGEESGGNEGGWLIDPIDGTGQYLFGVPLSSISIVRIQNGESIFAVVANIMTRELFIAERGKGAFLIVVNKTTELKVNQEIPIEQSIVSWDHVVQEKSEVEWVTELYKRNMQTFLKVRMFGSGALSLCYLARNYFQIFIKTVRKTKEKADIFAGLLIAQEAGAEVEIVQYLGINFYLVGTKNAIEAEKSEVLV